MYMYMCLPVALQPIHLTAGIPRHLAAITPRPFPPPLQVLTLDGLPLQALKGGGPLSGICADEDHVCATSLEGDHAITIWRQAM